MIWTMICPIVLSDRDVQTQLIAQLPHIAQHLPAPQEQRTTIITGDSSEGLLNPLVGFLTTLAHRSQDMFHRAPPTPDPTPGSATRDL